MTQPLREARWQGSMATFPGKTEWGCLYQSLRKGPLDRVDIYDEESDARLAVLSLRERGIEATLVSRSLPGWTETPTSLQELKVQREALLQARLAAPAASAATVDNDVDAANAADGISNG